MRHIQKAPRGVAQSSSRHLALYSGRNWIGSIFVRGDIFEARLAGRRVLGVFTTQAAAAAAIVAVYRLPTARARVS